MCGHSVHRRQLTPGSVRECLQGSSGVQWASLSTGEVTPNPLLPYLVALTSKSKFCKRRCSGSRVPLSGKAENISPKQQPFSPSPISNKYSISLVNYSDEVSQRVGVVTGVLRNCNCGGSATILPTSATQ